LQGDLGIALAFCTRLPVPRGAAIGGPDLARASWAFPVAGALIGALGALVYGLGQLCALPALPAAGLAVAATAALTGCLHEDGLADVADGFGGGNNRERKLEIMRDSRIGAYGAIALALSLLLRASALASFTEPARVAAAMIAAHAAARATMPVFMRLVPPARTDGLSAGAGRVPMPSAVVAGALGIVALVLGLGLKAGPIALIGTAAAIVLLRWICIRQVGGQTGDVVGAIEQVSEIVVLLTAAAFGTR